MSFLEVKNIYKKFGNSEVLKGIEFSVLKGEVLSIIGSSGSGKTTLLRCLNLLETADTGTVRIAGDMYFDAETFSALNEREIREKRLRFGLVFQSFNLFPQYTVLNNIILAPVLRFRENARCKNMSNAEKKREYEKISTTAIKLLGQVGLSEKKDAYPCELSGGQCQRVAIARALALNPDVLCFDEPTSALDPELTGEVLKVIRGLKSSDRTMIVVTHEMEFARNVSDKVIFMADGVIEEIGKPNDLFLNPQSPKLKAFLKKSLEN